jgi:uncharacterized protein
MRDRRRTARGGNRTLPYTAVVTTVVRFGGAEARRAALAAELERLTTVLRGLPGVVEAWVFGSTVSGHVHAGSDIDLLVVRHTDEPPAERALTLVRELSSALPLDVFVYTPEELAAGGRFVRSALANGRRLW